MTKNYITVDVTTKAGVQFTFQDDATHGDGSAAARSLDLHEAIDAYGQIGEGELTRYIIPYDAIDSAPTMVIATEAEAPEDANCKGGE